MVLSATQGNSSPLQTAALLSPNGEPALSSPEKGSSIASQKPLEQAESETPRQTLCGRIAALLKSIWEFFFGSTEEEEGSDTAEEAPPPTPGDDSKKVDTKSEKNGPTKKPGDTTTPPPDSKTKGNKEATPPIKFTPPQEVTRATGRPLQLYNFAPYADANVCWLNSLTQLLLADKDLLDAAVEAFRACGHNELAEHFAKLHSSTNAYARVNSDLLFQALANTSAAQTVVRNSQNDPGEAFQSLLTLQGSNSFSFLLLPIITDLISLVDKRALQQDGHITPNQLETIIKDALTNKDQRANWPKDVEWPPAHLLVHLARTTRTPEPAMAFHLPALRQEESMEQTRISIRETIKLLRNREIASHFSDADSAISLLETLLEEGNSLVALHLQMGEISTLGNALSHYAKSLDTSGARRFADNNPAYAHIMRTSYLLLKVLGCTYTKAKLDTLAGQIAILRDLCQQRMEELKRILDDGIGQNLRRALPQTRAGGPDYKQIFYEQLREALCQLVSTDPGRGEFLQAIEVEKADHPHANDEISLLSLLHTQFHCPTHPDRKTNSNYAEITSGPSKIWDRVRELLSRVRQELANLTSKQQEALKGVENFVNNHLCQSFSYTRQKVPPLPRFHLPNQTTYNINDVEYELKGVVKHSNSSGEGGHYTALVPGFDCSDTRITPINEAEFQRRAASGGDVILHLKKKKNG